MPALLLLALLASLAPAEADGVPPEAPFLGERYRYGNMPVIPRVLHDIPALPGAMPWWEPEGWLLFGGVGLFVGGMMLPLDPSPDVRLDRWLLEHGDPVVPEIWTTPMQVALWGGMAVGGFGTWGAAALFDWPEVAEGMSLAGEALAVSQFYHLSLKLLIGREGPRDGDGLGLVLGPAHAFRLFPAGTPGGHAATLYSVLGALEAWYAPPWPVVVLDHAVVGGLILAHVANHRHFLSDAVWGGTMGYAVGRWVVRHRSTRYAYDAGAPVRLQASWCGGPGVTAICVGGPW